jgi:hypothetical protein
MLNNNRRRILAIRFALMALLAGALPVAAQSSHYNLRMENDTGFSIYRLYISYGEDGG